MKPCPSTDLVHSLVASRWGKEVVVDSIAGLQSYDDANFYLQTTNGEEYLVKFYNASQTLEYLLGNAALIRTIDESFKINAIDVRVTSIVPSLTGASVELVDECTLLDDDDVAQVGVCLFNWIPGCTLNSKGYSPQLLVGVGRTLAHLTNALTGFHHPCFDREHMWTLSQFDRCMDYVDLVERSDIRAIISDVFRVFQEDLLPAAEHDLPMSVVMGDCNDANVIVSPDGSSIRGIIDFGDTCHCWTVCEITIAISYALLSPYGLTHPDDSIRYLLGGYSMVRSLQLSEIRHMRCLVAVRMCMSITIGALSLMREPENAEYLRLHSVPALTALAAFWNRVPEEVEALFHAACSAGERLRDTLTAASDEEASKLLSAEFIA